ncbi:MAG: alpha/beta hydrolase [Chloroflexi bacterium]|nr:alpha/beta hydrolase [Chloroflexota bacterium]
MPTTRGTGGRSAFLYRRTAFLAHRADARFSYCLYVPDEIRQVCVYVHGTYRDAAVYRDQLSDFAIRHRVLVLCPLFPAGLIDPDDVDNYKQLLYRGIRFGLILLDMLEEIRARYDLANDRFMLGGFSGGAQFAHRFAYLHPGHVRALSLAAPGRVTLLDESLDWWSGIRNVEQLFGQIIDAGALRDMPIQLLIGANDDANITINRGDADWTPDENRAGSNRRQRLEALYLQYRQIGCDVSITVVPDCGHDWLPLRDATVRFFETSMQALD